ncbi:dynamin family protein, partial [Lactococcus lactis]
FDDHVILEGGRDIVEEYGEREGDKYNSELAEEEVIFTYVDSEILNTIDIYDTPGTDAGEDETSEMDEQISADMRNNADAVIYLMTANQFLHRQDFQLLRRDIERLPSLFDGKNGL